MDLLSDRVIYSSGKINITSLLSGISQVTFNNENTSATGLLSGVSQVSRKREG